MDEIEEMHEAVGRFVCEGEELVTRWVLTAEVVGPEQRVLVHRSGTADGERPMIWDALGMLKGSLVIAEMEMRQYTTETDDEEEDDGSE